jgi:hypothetical protein
MKTRSFVAALLVAALAWSQASAQAWIYQGPNYLAIDASRSLLVRESTPPDRDAWMVWTNAINDTISSASNQNSPFSAESTAVLNVSTLRTITAFIKWNPTTGGDTSSTYTYAVQVRAHNVQSEDSSTTAIWHRPRALVAAGDAPDTVGHNPISKLNVYNAASGEFILQFNVARYLPTAHRSWNGQTGIYVLIASRDGGGFWAPYMSIRIRNLGPNLAGKSYVRMDVMGSPL